jgi:hypothetical protein
MDYSAALFIMGDVIVLSFPPPKPATLDDFLFLSAILSSSDEAWSFRFGCKIFIVEPAVSCWRSL